MTASPNVIAEKLVCESVPRRAPPPVPPATARRGWVGRGEERIFSLRGGEGRGGGARPHTRACWRRAAGREATWWAGWCGRPPVPERAARRGRGGGRPPHRPMRSGRTWGEGAAPSRGGDGKDDRADPSPVRAEWRSRGAQAGGGGRAGPATRRRAGAPLHLAARAARRGDGGRARRGEERADPLR